jgi:hypothetical protein
MDMLESMIEWRRRYVSTWSIYLNRDEVGGWRLEMELEMFDVPRRYKVQGTSGDIVVTRISLPLTAESRSASTFAVGVQSSLPRINKG